MAIEKVIELKVNETQADKALKKFGGTLEDVYGEGVQPLNFAIGELEDRLYEMAAAGDTSSRQFKEMSEEVGKMKKVIIDTDLVLDGMSQTTAQKVGGAVSGLASGFELAQGAMGAFGVESEAVQETLLRVQSAMAISQGIQGIKEAIPSFKALSIVIGKTAVGQKLLNAAQVIGASTMKLLNAAMAANPIMLVVAGVGALVGALAWFFGSSEDATKANEELNASLEKQNKILERNQAQVSKNAEIRRRLLVANGATEKELHEDTIKRLKEEENARYESAKATAQAISDRQKMYIKARRNGQDDLARDIKAEIRAEKDKLAELQLNNKEYRTALKEENARYREHEKQEEEKAAQEESQQLKERRDRYKQYQQNRLSALRQTQDLELELSQDEIKANNLKYERLIEDTKSNENLKQKEKEDIVKSYEALRKVAEDKILADREAKEKASLQKIADFKRQAQEQALDDEAAFYEVYNQNTLTQQQLEEQAITDKYFNLIEKAKQYNLDTVELERKQAEELQAIQDNANKRDLDAEKAKRDTQFQMANDALSAISQLVTAFAGDNEEAQKKAFNINKGISIAQAIMNTAQAVTGALAEPSIVPGARFVKAGIAAATGAAQIATISRTKFQSGGGGIGGGTGGGVNAPNISQQAPTFNVVGDTGVNQLAQSLGSSPMKAYVVAGDVTSAQSLERNKIEQSTL